MIQNPIHRALSTIRKHGIRHLVMGGQACVLYGAAEFSRDLDLAFLADEPNLKKLQGALDALQAEPIAVPPFEKRHLDDGLAVHFRCHRSDVRNLRIDLMTKMRGVDPFEALWDRRTSIQLESGFEIDLLSLPDLVQAKKTQRDKDWPMIARLVEANYFQNRDSPSAQRVDFWLRELRTGSLLIELAKAHPKEAERRHAVRPALANAIKGDEAAVIEALEVEVRREKQADAEYWRPLKDKLARMKSEAAQRRSSD